MKYICNKDELLRGNQNEINENETTSQQRDISANMVNPDESIDGRVAGGGLREDWEAWSKKFEDGQLTVSISEMIDIWHRHERS